MLLGIAKANKVSDISMKDNLKPYLFIILRLYTL